VAAFMIFLREGAVFNPKEMEAYSKSNRNTKQDFKLQPLVVYGDFEALEGEAPDGVVLLEFPTMEDAKTWYYSPGYQAAMEHRKRAADYRVILVEGV
jgi:uncharacterized protein (DUF1330 family)